jgi:hypothetical protein
MFGLQIHLINEIMDSIDFEDFCIECPYFNIICLPNTVSETWKRLKIDLDIFRVHDNTNDLMT